MKTNVLEAIEAERAYQLNKWGKHHDDTQSLAGYLLIIESELNEAKRGWNKNLSGRDSSLSELVQVVAVAVAALEKFGVEGNPR